MILAIVNGLLTSLALKTCILVRQMNLTAAFRTTIGMSFISMIPMEAAMNAADVVLTGGAKLTWWGIPVMLAVGVLKPLPYNYWRLKALGRAGHGRKPALCRPAPSHPCRRHIFPAAHVEIGRAHHRDRTRCRPQGPPCGEAESVLRRRLAATGGAEPKRASGWEHTTPANLEMASRTKTPEPASGVDEHENGIRKASSALKRQIR